MTEEQREAMFSAWKLESDLKVKKCLCKNPEPKAINLNECFNCDGNIYMDWLAKTRWFSSIKNKNMINIQINGNDKSELLIDVQNNEIGITVLTKDNKQFDFCIEQDEWEIVKKFIESQFKIISNEQQK